MYSNKPKIKDSHMTKIGAIYGSSRPSKAGEGIARWFEGATQLPEGASLEMIDLADINLPLLAEPMPPMMGQYEFDSTKEWAEKIAGLDAFVFVMSEYNSGYTAILKNAVDTLYGEWGGKKTAVISYGAGPESNAAQQFREVLAKINMDVSSTQTHIHTVHEAIDDDGSLNLDYLNGSSAQEMLNSVL